MTFADAAIGSTFIWLGRRWTKISDRSYTLAGSNDGPGMAKGATGKLRAFAPTTVIEPT